MQRLLSLFLLIALHVSLSGCGSRPVAQDLTQKEATEIVALLNAHGITAIAERGRGAKASYTVEISESAYGEAISLLNAFNLPGERRPNINELLAPSGLIPSSRESEMMRLDYAVASQIEELLQSHGGIFSARAIVRLNSVTVGQEPAVSLVIQSRAGATPPSEEEIKNVLTRAVPGVKADLMTIAITPQTLSAGTDGEVTQGVSRDGTKVRQVPLVRFLWFWRVPVGEYTGLACVLVASLCVVGFAAYGLGFWTCLYRRTREPMETSLPEVFPRNPKVERLGRDEGES